MPLTSLAIETVGVSLSATVLVSVSGAPNVARPKVMLLKVTSTVSGPSTMASSTTVSVMMAKVEPAGMVTEAGRP